MSSCSFKQSTQMACEKMCSSPYFSAHIGKRSRWERTFFARVRGYRSPRGRQTLGTLVMNRVLFEKDDIFEKELN